MNAIEVHQVHKSFGKVTALAGVDLAVPQGEVLGLLGHNGAGKTTLVRILATLLAPDSGRVVINGHDVVREPVAVRRQIGLAGQHAAIDDALTGRENLELVGTLYRLGKATVGVRAREILERLSLDDAADRPVRTYSGGMRRRLDVGASLVGRPSVLLLDEPSTGLDPVARLELWGLIRDLTADGTTVLLTTQALEEADYLARDIVVLQHGSVIAHGTTAELKARLGHTAITVVIEDHADLARAGGLLAGISAGEPEIDTATTSVVIRMAEGSSGLATAVRLLDDARISIADIGVRAPSLEDVYLSLTDAKGALR
ncbi:ATP-binding cassette domain-containing protein [Nocardia acidivorans]|uniref:ATP-binding cassette domain-containing protein n=1 Tax=Nocardia acidivorans TaxID=404580 RepID=UPI000836B43B|nr:ATP-binding cassette domain-containing protein [Nocardia acidivorans]